MRNYFLILLGLLLLSSCCKEYDCNPQKLILSIKGVDTLNTDTLLIQTYTKGGDFTQLIKTDTIILADSTIENMPFEVTMYSDTAVIRNYSSYNQYGIVSYESDWKLITKNNTYLITDIAIKEEVGCCGGILSIDCKKNCVSPITTYKLNGAVQTVNPDLYYNYLYLDN